MAKFHCVHRQPILPQTSTSLTFVRSLMTDGPSMRLLHFLRKLRKLLQVALAPTGGLQYVTRYRIVPCTAALDGSTPLLNGSNTTKTTDLHSNYVAIGESSITVNYFAVDRAGRQQEVQTSSFVIEQKAWWKGSLSINFLLIIIVFSFFKANNNSLKSRVIH